MSAERGFVAARLALVCALMLAGTAVRAGNEAAADIRPASSEADVQRISVPSPEYPYLAIDPLRTRPGRLDAEVPLPGDAEAIDCSPSATTLPAHPLSLAEAVDMALCHSPQVQAAWAATKVRAAALGQSRAAWLPTANATVSQLHNRTTYPDSPMLDSSKNGSTAYVGVTWRLFDFGARAADNESAARLLDAALANQDGTLQKVLGAVVQAYFDAVSSRAAVRSRGEATQYARQTLEATRRREAKGAAATNDTLQANAALAKARLAEQRAVGDYQKAISVLLYACGISPDSNVELVEEDEVVPATAVAGLAAWLEATVAKHPAIRAAQAQVDAAEAKVRVVRTQGMPSVDFTGNYYRNGYPNQGLQSTRSATTTVGVTVNIPLFEGFARTYQVREAQAEVDQSRSQLLDARLQLASTVVKDHADAVAALANLDASAQWQAAAVAAVDSARRRYDKGAGDILDLVAAESALADARQERIRCLAEWRSARLRLFADSGMLGKSRAAMEVSPIPESGK